MPFTLTLTFPYQWWKWLNFHDHKSTCLPWSVSKLVFGITKSFILSLLKRSSVYELKLNETYVLISDRKLLTNMPWWILSCLRARNGRRTKFRGLVVFTNRCSYVLFITPVVMSNHWCCLCAVASSWFSWFAHHRSCSWTFHCKWCFWPVHVRH